MYKPKFFKAYELVPREIYQTKTEDEIFAMFNPAILRAIDRIRQRLGKVTINNWKNGGSFSQRGFRTHPKTGSQHCIGNGLDFDVAGMTAKQVRNYIKYHEKEFPEIKRMEDDVSWVHIDGKEHNKCEGIYLFKP